MTLARAYALSNDIPSALATFRQFIAMGQSSGEFLTSPDFAALRSSPQFTELAAAMRANESPLSRSSLALSLDSLTGLIAEDVDYDSASQSFFFSTVLGKKIFAATSDGHLREFASPPTNLPLLAVKVDPARKLLWASAVGLRNFAGVPESTQARSVLLCYSLSSGKLLRRLDGPPGATLGDFAVAPDGDLFLADNDGALYKLPRDSSVFERLDHGEFVSPQTPALSPDSRLLFLPDYLRGIAVLDLESGALRWLDAQGKFALSGIDGLCFSNGNLLAVQNGTSPERVVLFSLDSSLSRIISETVVERATPTLGDPTHGVLVSGGFFYIANSGWDTLDDHGVLKPNSKPSAPRLMRFPLP